jgi:hypothetical protein
MRSRRVWFNEIPELANYKFLIRLKNPRNPTISLGNMQPGDFDKVVNALTKP